MKLGVVEGFYGRTWGWDRRADALDFLAAQSYEFYLYAPKADPYLRRRWQEPHPASDFRALRNFSAQCRDAGITFGVGLSPLGLHRTWHDRGGRDDVEYKLEALRRLGVDTLAILFDDMRGDFADLAQLQADIVHYAADHAGVEHVWMCPTYYSQSSILDMLFGPRPSNYLTTLGDLLDPTIGVFWTGPKIVSKQYPKEHLAKVTDELQRKPVLWDNYPVNDGPLMCPHLHLRPPERPPALLDQVQCLAVNPMNQSWLSRIPMHAMSRTLRGDDATLHQSAHALLPPQLADRLVHDADDFQDRGLDEFTPDERDDFIVAYQAFDHPAAREVVDWLQGNYVVSTEILTDILA